MSDLAEKLETKLESTGRARATLDQLKAMWGDCEFILTDTLGRPLLVRRWPEGLGKGKKETWKFIEGTKHFELLGQ